MMAMQSRDDEEQRSNNQDMDKDRPQSSVFSTDTQISPRFSYSSNTQSTATSLSRQSQNSFPSPLRYEISNNDMTVKPIPYCTPETFIFPEQGCTESTRHRFDIVVNGLWNRIRNNTSLLTHRNDIAFRLFYCGPTAKDKQPAIVCFCKPEIAKSLRQLLSEKRKFKRIVQARSLLDKLGKSIPDIPEGPPFRIYYWAGDPYNILHSKQHDIMLKIRDGSADKSSWPSTMCGSSVHVPANSRTATIACSLKIGSKFYALTVAHAFSMEDTVAQVSLIHQDDVSPQSLSKENQEDPTSPEETSDFVLDDMDYNFPALNTAQNVTVQDLQTIYKHQDPEINLHGESFMVHVTTPESANTKPDIPDLDWALIELQDDSPVLQNFFQPNPSGRGIVALEDFASRPSDEDREVLILVADRAPIRGTLTCCAASLGGVTRSGPFSAYIITFEGDIRPVKGDSGALVIDADTHTAYAYLIASSPLGEAFAVPLMNCLQQIQDILNVDEVHLPTAQEILHARTAREQARFSMNGWRLSLVSVQSPAIAQLSSASKDFSKSNRMTIPPKKLSRDCCASNLKVIKWHNKDSELQRFEDTATSDALHPIVGDSSSALNIMFVDVQKTQSCKNCKQILGRRLKDAFRMSPKWFSKWCRRSGCFFGSEDTFDDQDKLDGHNTWFCFDAKQTEATLVAGDHQSKDYSWWKTDVYIRWHADTGHSTILCLDTPKLLQEILLETIESSLKMKGQGLRYLSPPTSPYSIVSLFAEAAVDIHSKAVWGIHDFVRSLEKTRLDGEIPDPTETRLHAGMRHTIHVAETLRSTRTCVDSMLAAHENWIEWNKSADDISADKQSSMNATNRQTYYRLANASRSLGTLLDRADALRNRFDNEVQLSFHTLSLQVAKATQADSSAMRTLGYVGIVFLPATFISTLFSSEFFFTDHNTGSLYLHSQFWWFWVATAILTTIVVVWIWLPTRSHEHVSAKHATPTRQTGFEQVRGHFTRFFHWSRPKKGTTWYPNEQPEMSTLDVPLNDLENLTEKSKRYR